MFVIFLDFCCSIIELLLLCNLLQFMDLEYIFSSNVRMIIHYSSGKSISKYTKSYNADGNKYYFQTNRRYIFDLGWISIRQYCTCTYFFFYKLKSTKYGPAKPIAAITVPMIIIVQLSLAIETPLLLLSVNDLDDDTFFLTILLDRKLSVLWSPKRVHLKRLVYLKIKFVILLQLLSIICTCLQSSLYTVSKK